jgi:Phytanoyl-CoA dioxygenase (PhyH)
MCHGMGERCSRESLGRAFRMLLVLYLSRECSRTCRWKGVLGERLCAMMTLVPILTFDAGRPTAELKEALDRDGVLVVGNLLAKSELEAVGKEVRSLVSAAPLGDNRFDGFKTRRIFDPLARTRIFDSLVLHPVVQAVVNATLSWPYQLGMTVLSDVQPGEVAQVQHRDGAVYPLPAEFPEVMVTTIWALDEWRSDNGATMVVPGSHRDRGLRAAEPAVMPAGSALLYVGGLLHGAGANQAATPRLGLIVEHVARWLRPAECHPLSVGPTLAATLVPDLQELLGFNQTNEYFGFIAGRPPRAWLSRVAATS